MSFAERRKYPRVFESLACTLSIGSCVMSTETKNLSCGGALCALGAALPLMTKLEVTIQLPAAPDGSAARSIRCVGVVVRQDPPVGQEDRPSYLTALYFSQLEQADRRRIAEYVLQSMLSHDRRRS